MLKPFFLILFILLQFIAGAQQRVYTNMSVLAKGDWYRIAISEDGVYKVDYRFLSRLGINANNLPSSAIRLFGNGGGMLPEHCGASVTDDLQENAIEVFDGGDGIFNGSDYFLFYGKGPDEWVADTVTRQFHHRKNLYSNRSFYYITVRGTGKRVSKIPKAGNPSTLIYEFSERIFHESDLVNLLSSGKHWYGEQFGNAAGKTAWKSFTVPLASFTAGQEITLRSQVIARAVGGQSSIVVRHNNRDVLTHHIQPTGAGNNEVFAMKSMVSSLFSPSSNELSYHFHSTAFGAEAWLDWFEVSGRRRLMLEEGKQLLFRDWNSVKPGATAEFMISNASPATRIWEVTNPSSPQAIDIRFDQDTSRFTNDCSVLREYISFENNCAAPTIIGKVKNQNLHAPAFYDMIIITPAELLPEANRLAEFHRQNDHLTVIVAETKQVFNEFASGIPDPAAIRNFVKMFYDRAGNDSTKAPRYLLLFGDASYDPLNRIKNNNNLVPSYQSGESLDPLSTYTSDDFFGFLDDWEDINSTGLNLLDIGIGRIPAGNLKAAKRYIDKVINYHKPEAQGSWRNVITFVADDEDYNMHFEDAEEISREVTAAHPDIELNKIYLDAYEQEVNASGNRYPEVQKALKEKLETGSLIINYTGHGGWRRLAEETILDEQFVNTWENNKLPLFVTATCDFAPYDNPVNYSLGENILMREHSGAIALMTTTRLVFAFSNRVLNRNYMKVALQPKPDGCYRSLGDAMREAKNVTYSTFNDPANNRKFTLLGDPALTLAFPLLYVQTTHINDRAISVFPDTLKASGKYVFRGEVREPSGNRLDTYNGEVFVTLFDKPDTLVTRGNDPGSIRKQYLSQGRVLSKGRATVRAGVFTVPLVLPKDIDDKVGNVRLSFYTANGETDGNGSLTEVVIRGSVPVQDKQGPEIDVWLDDFSFVSGNVVSERPLLILSLKDSSGINISERGTGHQITATLDGDVHNNIILNPYFIPEKDSYKSGSVEYRLPLMNEGVHRLTIKAWDGCDHSGEKELTFSVVKDKQVIVDLFNYPNPVTNQTSFCFDHNQPTGEWLETTVNIFSISGQLVKSIYKTINANGYRSCDIEWNGLDEYGNKLKSGIYIWQLHVETTDGRKANKSKMLVVL